MQLPNQRHEIAPQEYPFAALTAPCRSQAPSLQARHVRYPAPTLLCINSRLSTLNTAPKRGLNGRMGPRGYAQRYADKDMNALCAEGEGFEPPRPVKGLPVFKTGAFNQALPPLRGGVVYSNIYSPRYVTGAQYAKFLPTDRPIFTDRKWVGS